MKKIVRTLSLIMLFTLTFCFCSCDKNNNNENSDSTIIYTSESTSDSTEEISYEEKFYNVVTQSQQLLDALADEIYDNWYDAIYNDDFYGSIDIAIAYAFNDNEENIDTIKENDTTIQNLYKQIRDGKLSEETKTVLHAYTDYYEFVINVSGSFNTYSSSKETKKKTLATALKNLSYEI